MPPDLTYCTPPLSTNVLLPIPLAVPLPTETCWPRYDGDHDGNAAGDDGIASRRDSAGAATDQAAGQDVFDAATNNRGVAEIHSGHIDDAARGNARECTRAADRDVERAQNGLTVIPRSRIDLTGEEAARQGFLDAAAEMPVLLSEPAATLEIPLFDSEVIDLASAPRRLLFPGQLR
jgi:hypothetical protein